MTAIRTRVAPPNSLLFISGPDGGSAPFPERGAAILSTPSCISVSCLMSQDGESEVVLGPAKDIHPGRSPAFDGQLEVPHRVVTISTVEGEIVLEAPVADRRTRVRIWVNRPRDPDEIIVGLG